jgi:hypothetical protein
VKTFVACTAPDPLVENGDVRELQRGRATQLETILVGSPPDQKVASVVDDVA